MVGGRTDVEGSVVVGSVVVGSVVVGSVVVGSVVRSRGRRPPAAAALVRTSWRRCARTHPATLPSRRGRACRSTLSIRQTVGERRARCRGDRHGRSVARVRPTPGPTDVTGGTAELLAD